MRIILRDVDPEDFILAIRAVKSLMARSEQDAVILFGEGAKTKDFYVRRNKASITVRPCRRAEAG